jgi:CheY-like chemotaxis protein
MNNGKLILIVEDSPEIQETMKMLLELENYAVSLAGTGNDALNLLKSDNHFSLILLDITLPDMKAFEFLEKLDKAGLLEKTPIVLCSGAADLKHMELPRGVVGILAKPFDVEVLFSVVKNSAK